MSEPGAPITATRNARFAGPDATISEIGPLGMITIRADLDDPAVASAMTEATGLAVPPCRRFIQAESESVENGGVAWMSPDELLYFTRYDAGRRVVADLRCGFSQTRHLIANVSDARAVFRIEGRGARALIARGAPVDLATESFGAGDFRRTRLGQVAVAFWLGNDEAFTLICFRSVGAYVYEWLKASALAGGRPAQF